MPVVALMTRRPTACRAAAGLVDDRELHRRRAAARLPQRSDRVAVADLDFDRRIADADRRCAAQPTRDATAVSVSSRKMLEVRDPASRVLVLDLRRRRHAARCVTRLLRNGNVVLRVVLDDVDEAEVDSAGPPVSGTALMNGTPPVGCDAGLRDLLRLAARAHDACGKARNRELNNASHEILHGGWKSSAAASGPAEERNSAESGIEKPDVRDAGLRFVGPYPCWRRVSFLITRSEKALRRDRRHASADNRRERIRSAPCPKRRS